MATFTYKCPICGSTTEISRSIFQNSDHPVCKKCGKKMQRVFDACTFLLKANDFYKKN